MCAWRACVRVHIMYACVRGPDRWYSRRMRSSCRPVSSHSFSKYLRACVHRRSYVRVGVCTCVCARVCVRRRFCARVRVGARVRVCVRASVCVHVCVCARARVCVRARVSYSYTESPRAPSDTVPWSCEPRTVFWNIPCVLLVSTESSHSAVRSTGWKYLQSRVQYLACVSVRARARVCARAQVHARLLNSSESELISAIDLSKRKAAM